MSDIKTRSGATTQPAMERAAIPISTGTDTNTLLYSTGVHLVKQEKQPASMLFIGLAIAGGAGWYWLKKQKKSKR